MTVKKHLALDPTATAPPTVTTGYAEGDPFVTKDGVVYTLVAGVFTAAVPPAAAPAGGSTGVVQRVRARFSPSFGSTINYGGGNAIILKPQDVALVAADGSTQALSTTPVDGISYDVSSGAFTFPADSKLAASVILGVTGRVAGDVIGLTTLETEQLRQFFPIDTYVSTFPTIRPRTTAFLQLALYSSTGGSGPSTLGISTFELNYYRYA